MNRPTHETMLRTARHATSAVTPIELFFDLVFVFAVTQLSDYLVHHRTVDGAAQTAVLLALMWQVWVYTTWATNFVDPHVPAVRVMMLGLMFASLLFAAALDKAFTDRGALVAAMYLTMQLGRCLFMLWALRGEDLLRTFQRILPWSTTSGTLVVLGVAVDGHAREALWAASVLIDTVGAAFGFWVPGLGRAATAEWQVAGSHFAERCQAFVLIALGESIVITGTQVSRLTLDATGLASVAVVFVSSVAMWWLYFDRAAADSANKIAQSPDPGKLARNAFHWIHPLIIGGVIVAAAGDEAVLGHPKDHADTPTAWFVLGGIGLFLAGHALFKAVVWRVVPVSRLVGLAALLALAPAATHISALALGACALVVAVGVAIADRVLRHGLEGEDEDRAADEDLIELDEVDGTA